jgi:hypothetical protein
VPTEATSVRPRRKRSGLSWRASSPPASSLAHNAASGFLRYVVEKSFDPGSDALKEYTIAVDVFERDASYGSSIDATVRVEAGRLRSRLHEYYAEDGKHDPLIIDVPKGGYRAVFTKRLLAATTVDGARPSPAIPFVVPASPAASRKRSIWITAACILSLVGGAVVLRQRHHAPTPRMPVPHRNGNPALRQPDWSRRQRLSL